MDVQILDGKGDDLIVAHGPPAATSPAHARTTWERFRRQGRAAGMSRKESVAYATREVEKLHPSPADLPPLPPVVFEPPAVVDPPAVSEQPLSATESGLAGLGDLPAAWPVLPSNASLQAEVSWVQANRIRVKPTGSAVDLSLALSPAPSYAALSWLETSILYPAKFADVCVKAAQDQQDDQQDVKRERLALVEVQGLLVEAAAAGT